MSTGSNHPESAPMGPPLPGLETQAPAKPRISWSVLPAHDIQVVDLPGATGLNALHVLNLAESIAALGLLEPIVVDQHLRLLAGAHRLAAIQLLMVANPDARLHIFAEAGSPGMVAMLTPRIRRLSVEGFRELYPDARIMVLVLDTSGESDIPAAVRRAEIAARQQWRVDIAQELQNGGFVARNRLARKLPRTVATLTIQGSEDLGRDAKDPKPA